jgi:hypothetical protein
MVFPFPLVSVSNENHGAAWMVRTCWVKSVDSALPPSGLVGWSGAGQNFIIEKRQCFKSVGTLHAMN